MGSRKRSVEEKGSRESTGSSRLLRPIRYSSHPSFPTPVFEWKGLPSDPLPSSAKGHHKYGRVLWMLHILHCRVLKITVSELCPRIADEPLDFCLQCCLPQSPNNIDGTSVLRLKASSLAITSEEVGKKRIAIRQLGISFSCTCITVGATNAIQTA